MSIDLATLRALIAAATIWPDVEQALRKLSARDGGR